MAESDRNLFSDLSEPPLKKAGKRNMTGGQDSPNAENAQNGAKQTDGTSPPTEPGMVATSVPTTVQDNGSNRMEGVLQQMLLVQQQQMNLMSRFLQSPAPTSACPTPENMENMPAAKKRKTADTQNGGSLAANQKADQPRPQPQAGNSRGPSAGQYTPTRRKQPRDQVSTQAISPEISEGSDEEDEFAGILKESESESDGELFTEVLDEFEETFRDTEKTGDEVNEKLAASVNSALRSKMNVEAKSKIQDLYDRPKNVSNLVVPKVNSELWSVLKTKPSIKARELALAKMHKTVTKAIVPVLQIADHIMTVRTNKGQPDLAKMLKASTDSLRLMSGLYGEMVVARRQNIKPTMRDSYKSLCGFQNPVTENLFGDDLAKRMKEIRETKNTESSWKEDASASRGLTRKYQGQGRFRHTGNQRWKHQNPHKKREWRKNDKTK